MFHNSLLFIELQILPHWKTEKYLPQSVFLYLLVVLLNCTRYYTEEEGWQNQGYIIFNRKFAECLLQYLMSTPTQLLAAFCLIETAVGTSLV